MFASINHTLTVVKDTEQPKQLVPYLASRAARYNIQMKKLRGPHDRLRIDARVISKRVKRNIIILDVDKKPILTISSHDIRYSIALIYNPPCPLYPGGHFDAYFEGKVEVGRYSNEDIEDYNLLYTAIKVCVNDEYDDKYHISRRFVKTYIDEHPSEAGRLLSIDAYTHQLKRGRALLRLDVTHPTRQMNPYEYVGLDSLHLFSCIEQGADV